MSLEASPASPARLRDQRVYLRLLGKPVTPTYGPTADVSWTGADPTTSVSAAQRK